MELLALLMQALAVAWVVFVGALGAAAARRALAARRRRLAWWRDLIRSSRSSLDTLGPITWADDYISGSSDDPGGFWSGS